MKKNQRNERRGSTLIVICILLGLLMVAIAFSVDVARIQLTQLELQSVADLSTRAGAEAMSRGVGDPNDLALTDAAIRDEVLMVSQLNTVSGAAPDLSSSDITFGRANQLGGGQLEFQTNPGGTITSDTDSIRVEPGLDNYPIAFGKFVGREEVDLGTHAAAMVQDRDIVIVLDRSGSMNVRDAGTIPIADYPLFALEQGFSNDQDPHHPDHPGFLGSSRLNVLLDINGSNVKLTRMQALRLAVGYFLDEVEATRGEERIGLTTYAKVANSPSEGQSPVGGHDYNVSNGLSAAEMSEIMGLGYSNCCTTLSPCTFGSDWQDPAQKYASALEDESTGYASFRLNYLAMRWAELTHVTDGINVGVDILFGDGSRPLARPVLILMTDGRHNQSGDPLVAAQTASANHPELLIYTISFGNGADQDLMGDIGDVTDGRHYHAANVSQLIQVFKDLGKTAGVTLIE